VTMQAAFEALTDEAAEWDDTSGALDTAATEVSGLTLTSAQFSAMVIPTGVADRYEEARAHIEAVCRAGMKETKDLADALRQVRDDFQSQDQAVRDEVAGLWIPEG
jgi:hypothetical protein